MTVANDITGNADSSKNTILYAHVQTGLPETVYVHLTGEKVDLSDIKSRVKSRSRAYSSTY